MGNDFDSDEIEQIMNEITELQEEMKANVATVTPMKAAPPAPSDDAAIMSEFHGESDSNMEETLAHLPEEEPKGPSLLDQAVGAIEETGSAEAADTELHAADTDSVEPENDVPHAAQLHRPVRAPIRTGEETMPPITAQDDSNEGSLVLTLTGNMTLKLKCDFEGQQIIVGFSDGALKVQLADGTEFKIPVRRKALKNAA